MDTPVDILPDHAARRAEAEGAGPGRDRTTAAPGGPRVRGARVWSALCFALAACIACSSSQRNVPDAPVDVEPASFLLFRLYPVFSIDVERFSDGFRTFEEAEKLAKTGDEAGAADLFMKAAVVFRCEPTRPNADIVLGNRLICYANAAFSWLNAGQPETARDALRRAAADDPELADDLLKKAAALPHPPSYLRSD